MRLTARNRSMPVLRQLSPALLAVALFACGGAPSPAVTLVKNTCPVTGVSVQVLGSGGPEGITGRSLSSYLVRLDGLPKVLIDVGAGTFSRFHDAGARAQDLEAILLSQLGPGHVSDLPALLDAARFANRRRPLAIVGPAGAPDNPSTAVWLQLMVGPRGPFPTLARLLTPGEPYRVAINDVSADAGTDQLVFAEGDLEIRAVSVPHAARPSIGYLVQIGEQKIAFTGDQRADDPRFLNMVRGADVLVAHVPATEDSPPVVLRNHARPAIVGALAKAAGVGRLVLSHWSTATLTQPKAVLDPIGSRYEGPIDVVGDFDCIALPAPPPAE